MISVIFFSAALTLIVKTGMSPGDNPLAVSPIDGLNGPVEVRTADGTKVPCAVRTDGDGRRFVAFRLGKVEILRRLEYRVSECAASGKEPKGIPAILPGMNLISNPNLRDCDKDGNPVGWYPTPDGHKVGKWTGKIRANVQTKHDSTRFQNGCWATYIDGLEAGHVYRLSFDALVDAERSGVIVWYCGKDGRWTTPLPGIRNYKSSKDLAKTEQWTHIEDTSFVYFDKALKRHIFVNRNLLPGT